MLFHALLALVVAASPVEDAKLIDNTILDKVTLQSLDISPWVPSDLSDAPRAFDIPSCGKPTDHFIPTAISITPNPPQVGGTVKIGLEGNVNTEIVAGTKVDVVVKLGFIPVKSLTVDFCEEAAKYGKPCPIAPGAQTFTAGFDVPSGTPKGTYNLDIKVKSPSNQQVACLNGKLKLV
ncbi:Phosphatidylglycerol/phosphatidylinositol transfer protein [Globomyces sp. JEL0801]|nr:Phosphatidylglycerol/phosphatidylinositol transfer protein [Globomyces sp. JEL0801]